MNFARNSFVICLAAVGFAGSQSGMSQDDPWRSGDLQQFVLASLPQTSYMGVNLADITNERAQALKLRDVHGVEITRIEENSPASKAGLKTGDVVLEYNGQRVEGMEQFGRFVRETPAGREVKLLVSRDGNQQNVMVTIGARHGEVRAFAPDAREFQFNMPEITIPDMPGFQNWRTALLGVEAESLSPQLAEFFGVKEGALVRTVTKDSAAEKAGIKAGDVITKVDQESISSPSELSSAIRSARSKATFPVQIVRDHREMTINVTIANTGSSPVRMRVVMDRAQKM